MNNKLIGKYLFKKRKESEKTQKEVADKLGVTYQAVSRWETGDSLPDISILCMIADMYNVSVDEILQRKPVPKEKSDMIFLAGMSAFVYIFAIMAFLIINAIWLQVVAIGVFIIFNLAGLFPANIYYFSELEVKTKKDQLIYYSSYIPLIIGIIISVIITIK